MFLFDLKKTEIHRFISNQTIYQYNFRRGAKAKNIIPLKKYEHLTFFPRLISKLSIVNFTSKSQAFKVQISLFSKEIQKNLSNISPNSTKHILFVVGEGLREEEGYSLTKNIKTYLEYFFYHYY